MGWGARHKAISAIDVYPPKPVPCRAKGLGGAWARLGRERAFIPADAVNLREKVAKIQDFWDPKIVAQVNDSYLKLVKVRGEYVWHRHDREDELFLVLRGHLTVQFRDRDVRLKEGELVVVPKGVEHRPVAAAAADVLLIEPTTTLNTGNVREARTQEKLDWI